MGKNNTRILMQFAALAMVLTAAMMVEEAKSVRVCNIETNDLQRCRPAVTGNRPPPPVNACCAVIRAANLPCGCRFKSSLATYNIDPARARAVLRACGVRTIPPACA